MSGDVVGQALSRVDARLKVTGAATYAAEHRIDGLLYGVVVNSTEARGTVTAIATEAARAHPGVTHVLTDFSALRLAHSVAELVFHGQPIAVVVGTTAEAAAHGASLVDVTYDRKPARTDFDDPGATSVTAPSNPDYSRGDPDGAFASADATVDLAFTISRENHNPIELPSTIARWEGGKLTLWDKSQWVQGAARTVAGALGVPEQDVRVHCEYVGGGFGSAIRAYDHVVLAAFAALRTGRPVKVVLSRRQFSYGTGYRPASRQRLALGAGRTGRIESLLYEVRTETSRYDAYEEGLTDLPKFLYGVPHTRTRYRLTAIDTQSPASMRGPGVVSSAFALETAVDQLAHDLGIDPIELRLRNEPTRDEVTRLPFSTRKLRECYDLGARRFGWSRRGAAPGSRTDGDLLIGMGMATASYHNNRRQVGSRARVDADGTATVETATSDMGPGTTTSVMQVAADALGLPARQVTFRLGDSAYPVAPPHAGATTMASVGSAAHASCTALRNKFIAMAVADPASPLYRADPATVVVRDGRFGTGESGATDSHREILGRAGLPGLEVTATWGPGDTDARISSYGYGAVFAEVSVDPLLGLVRIRRMFAAYDVGRVISPKLAHSQAIGGMVGGIGMALMEATVTDHRDGRIVNASLADYLVPVNADVPELDAAFIDTEDPLADPIGVKGLGEITIVGVPAAIGNAVFNATGKRLTDLPIRLEALL
ncbi:xanthine dehydrogenase family protein molybdopterin-binding subunit [Streptomyces sp. WAC01280]|uniref:xanthine dehydrogenase family protein molybdopterin-binding subunit n=1 Tax=Streptomyces sp. WAC01280 TaxID=2487424 RepID=UPI000F7B3F43|nr:xanthine dehydrogenase family protein molybdopterin-binding subunit [Streptomyces sp. WAC01280]RSS56921.1 xanthine dehydrogenase family protein molybdopterin-binding subunit [Streptomyces sp. WAC01280]